MKKKILWGLLWRAFFFASNFLLNIAFARFFGVKDSGLIFFITNNLSLYLLVSTLNIETGIGFYAAKSGGSNAGGMLLMGLISAFFSSILLLFLQNTSITQSFFTAIDWPWHYSFLYVLGNVVITVISVLLHAKGNYWLPNLVQSGCTALLAVLYLFCEKWPVLDKAQCLEIYFWFFLFQGLVMLLAFFSQSKGQQPDKNQKIVPLLGPVLKYSLIALANNILFFLLYRMDYWFVEYFTGPADLGNYIQVSKFGQLQLLLPIIFSSIILPRVAEGSISQFNKFAAMAFVVIAVASFSGLAVVLLIGPSLFSYLLGNGYEGMFIPAVIKIPAMFLLSLQAVLGIWFSGINKVRYNLYCNLAGLFIMLVADILLIPSYGIIGASWACLIAFGGALATAIYFYHYRTGQSYLGLAKLFFRIIFNWRKESLDLLKSFR